mmetsp:Transcript_50040/g.160082  ORF Transcript_50040/g.160082 Transcript_50040/m.160082 type:complete len:201 (-) Transcript_50040:630-1232(-)
MGPSACRSWQRRRYSASSGGTWENLSPYLPQPPASSSRLASCTRLTTASRCSLSSQVVSLTQENHGISSKTQWQSSQPSDSASSRGARSRPSPARTDSNSSAVVPALTGPPPGNGLAWPKSMRKGRTCCVFRPCSQRWQPSMMFSGLRSQCTKPALCMACSRRSSKQPSTRLPCHRASTGSLPQSATKDLKVSWSSSMTM